MANPSTTRYACGNSCSLVVCGVILIMISGKVTSPLIGFLGWVCLLSAVVMYVKSIVRRNQALKLARDEELSLKLVQEKHERAAGGHTPPDVRAAAAGSAVAGSAAAEPSAGLSELEQPPARAANEPAPRLPLSAPAAPVFTPPLKGGPGVSSRFSSPASTDQPACPAPLAPAQPAAVTHAPPVPARELAAPIKLAAPLLAAPAPSTGGAGKFSYQPKLISSRFGAPPVPGATEPSPSDGQVQ
jgi:hypothetical protein